MNVRQAETGRPTALAAAAASLLALAAILAGCNLQRAPAPVVSARTGFFFNDGGDTAGLAYGEADSDNVGLMMQCERGARRVEITDAVHAGARKGETLVLASGGARSQLPTRVEVDEERGAPLASGQALTDNPVLTAFRKSGRVTVKLGAREQAYVASPAELISVARFFAVCEKRP
jgi:hypothetical protein